MYFLKTAPSSDFIDLNDSATEVGGGGEDVLANCNPLISKIQQKINRSEMFIARMRIEDRKG